MKALSWIKKPFRYSYTNAVFIIISINIAVYLLTNMLPQFYGILALNVLYILKYNFYWQFFTYFFVHAGFTHLLFNMLGLFFFGVAVERQIGSKEFLLLYFLSGVFCGLVSFLAYYFSGFVYVSLVGASGAVYAILLSYAVIFPRSNIFIWGILPVPAPILIGIYAVIAIFSQLTNTRDGVAHLTHLAGFAFAWLYFKIRMGISPWKVWRQNF